MPGVLAELLVGILAALLVATLVARAIGSLGFPVPQADRRIGCVDGLRGYLALAVLCHHFSIWLHVRAFGGEWSAPKVNLLNQLGTGSVSLFFMATGLVFYPRVVAGLRATDWRGVYISRVFRIVPMVVFSVVCVTLVIARRVDPVFDAAYLKSALVWIATIGEPPLLGYADSSRVNAAVLWSLRFEWQFYVLALPLCAFAADVVRRRGGPVWLVPVAMLVVAVLFNALPPAFRQTHPFFKYAGLFAIGMIAHECQQRDRVKRFFGRPLASLSATLALVVGAVASQFPFGWSMPLFGYFFISVACGNSVWGLLRSRGAIVLGEISFGIYVLHGILLDILFVDFAGLTARFDAARMPALLPLLAAGIVLCAAATFLLVERPGIRAGRWLARQTARRASPQPVAQA